MTPRIHPPVNMADRAYVGGHREGPAPLVVSGGGAHRCRRDSGRNGAMWRATFAAGIVVAVVAGVGGSALAYWHEIGAGAGSAATGTSLGLTLTPATPTASLYPGGSSDVALVISNPNSIAVTVASLALATTQGTGGFAVDAGHSGCATTSLSYATQTNTGAGWTVPARTGAVDGSLSISLANAVAMDVDAADACQGATFTVYLAAGS